MQITEYQLFGVKSKTINYMKTVIKKAGWFLANLHLILWLVFAVELFYRPKLERVWCSNKKNILTFPGLSQ